MANIAEETKWENDVYELAIGDDIIGGPDGVDNLPHKQLANRTAWLKQQVDGFQNMPTGSLIIWPTATPPAGYLECDGSALSRTTYAALYAVLGVTYGKGAGALANTTFRVPDLRGEFIRGWDHGRGVDNGRALGNRQTDAMQKIWGTIYRANSASAYSGAFYKKNGNLHTDPSGGASGNFMTGFDSSRVTRVAAETRPRNVAMMYAIKY